MTRPPAEVALHWRAVDAAALGRDDDLAGTWDRLNGSRLDLPFLSSSAMSAALDVFGDGREKLAVGAAGGEPVAMFLVRPAGRLRWSTIQPSQVPLGAWVASPEQSLDDLACGLLRSGALGFALALSVTQADPLMAPRDDDDRTTIHDDYIRTAWLEISGPFDDYWNARGKNLRQNLRKQRNRLAADGVPTQMRVWRDAAAMRGVLARYGELESTGWKAAEGTAIHLDNAQGRFYLRLLEQAASRGEALCTEYLFGDRTVAMNFGLLKGGTWIVLKTTYDESQPKMLSPSSLLREDELRCFFDRESGVRRLEYYGSLMDWHTKLTDHQRTLYHLTAFRWGWLRTLALHWRTRAASPTPTADRVAAETTSA